jgi:hypothetical protein
MDKKVVALVVLALIAVLATALLLYEVLSSKPKYVCLNGDVVSDVRDCPTTTTTITLVTTTIETTLQTVVTTSATVATTRRTTTTVVYDCMLDYDCGVNKNSTPYCSDNYVKVDELKPECISPASPNARCGWALTGRSHTIQTCSQREFCQSGQCIPRTCVNGIYDSNEEKIDCGGVCPKKCSQFNVVCNTDGDCGSTSCIKDYFCLGTNPSYYCYLKKCMKGGTNQSYCMEQNYSVTADVCGRGKHCVEGRGVCIEGGTCSDCERNQNELGVDCGGVCEPCAENPESFDTTMYFSIANGFKSDYVDIYENSYTFVLDRVLSLNCPYGAKIRLERNSIVIATGEVSNRENTMLNKFSVGLINVTGGSATIWVKETKPS